MRFPERFARLGLATGHDESRHSRPPPGVDEHVAQRHQRRDKRVVLILRPLPRELLHGRLNLKHAAPPAGQPEARRVGRVIGQRRHALAGRQLGHRPHRLLRVAAIDFIHGDLSQIRPGYDATPHDRQRHHHAPPQSQWLADFCQALAFRIRRQHVQQRIVVGRTLGHDHLVENRHGRHQNRALQVPQVISLGAFERLAAHDKQRRMQAQLHEPRLPRVVTRRHTSALRQLNRPRDRAAFHLQLQDPPRAGRDEHSLSGNGRGKKRLADRLPPDDFAGGRLQTH